MNDAESHTDTYALDLMFRAAAYATRKHEGQKRKYTGEPYILHCLEVSRLVAEAGGTAEMVAAAVLHDVVEDTTATFEEIEELFGPEVTGLVKGVTDISKPEDGNRAHRKAIDREHIAKGTPEIKTIKLADIISNTATVVEHARGFARYYLREKEQLLFVLAEGAPVLLMRAQAQIKEGLDRLSHSG